MTPREKALELAIKATAGSDPDGSMTVLRAKAFEAYLDYADRKRGADASYGDPQHTPFPPMPPLPMPPPIEEAAELSNHAKAMRNLVEKMGASGTFASQPPIPQMPASDAFGPHDEAMRSIAALSGCTVGEVRAVTARHRDYIGRVTNIGKPNHEGSI